MNKEKFSLPSSVEFTLKKLGKDINNARRKRRISKEMMAERAGIAINTLNAIENGKSGTSISSWVMVMYVLGIEKNLQDVCDVKNDVMGMLLDEENLPKRIRNRKNRYG
jgi:DNA-binding XRE family transcriptional regulator